MTRRESQFSEAALPLFAAAAVMPCTVGGDTALPDASAERRQRLRTRIRDHGARTLLDDELLELVLSRTLPGADASSLAQRLIERFGDFSGIVSASPTRLLDQPGIPEAAVIDLKVVEAAAHRLARARVMHRSVISSWDALLAYCRTTMAHCATEQFRVLFLDRQNALIADEEQGRGTVNHVPVYPREVAKRALELNASALILVHNHPSGDPTPSESDIAMTERIRVAVEALDMTLHDHLVIGRAGEVSFRDKGLL